MMSVAISIRQPWAALIVLGFKDVENRSWAIPRRYQGQRVCIHAGQQPDRSCLAGPRQPIRDAAAALATAAGIDALAFERRANAHPEALALGGIVGSAQLRSCTLNGSVSRWANPKEGTWHWQIAAPRVLPFTRCKGQLGFFAPAREPIRKLKQASFLE